MQSDGGNPGNAHGNAVRSQVREKGGSIMPTRKTHTSTAVKQRYIDKTYTSFSVRLRNETFDEIDAWLKERGISRASFIKTAFDIMQKNIKSEQ